MASRILALGGPWVYSPQIVEAARLLRAATGAEWLAFGKEPADLWPKVDAAVRNGRRVLVTGVVTADRIAGIRSRGGLFLWLSGASHSSRPVLDFSWAADDVVSLDQDRMQGRVLAAVLLRHFLHGQAKTLEDFHQAAVERGCQKSVQAALMYSAHPAHTSSSPQTGHGVTWGMAA